MLLCGRLLIRVQSANSWHSLLLARVGACVQAGVVASHCRTLHQHGHLVPLLCCKPCWTFTISTLQDDVLLRRLGLAPLAVMLFLSTLSTASQLLLVCTSPCRTRCCRTGLAWCR
jgi:hypothetical protein